jgi:hypothetical protein
VFIKCSFCNKKYCLDHRESVNHKYKEEFNTNNKSNFKQVSSNENPSKKSAKLPLRKKADEPIEFANNPQNAFVLAKRITEQLIFPVFLPLSMYHPMYMALPARFSIGKIIDLICELGKLNRKLQTGERLVMYSLNSGSILPNNSKLKDLIDSKSLKEGTPLVFEYAAEDSTALKGEVIEELMNHSKQILSKRCNTKVFQNSNNKRIYVF